MVFQQRPPETPGPRRIDLVLARLEEPQARALLALADLRRRALVAGDMALVRVLDNS